MPHLIDPINLGTEISLKCEKCKSLFKRESHLTRHLNRKTPCYKDLTCKRCFKVFNQTCNYKRHVNRKTKCVDQRDKELVIVDKKLELLTKEIELSKIQSQIRKDDLTKEIELSKIQAQIRKDDLKIIESKRDILKLEARGQKDKESTAGTTHIYGNQVNIFNIDVKTIINLMPHEMIKTEVIENYTSDTLTLIGNLLSHQYNSIDSELVNNKCIKSIRNSKNNYYVKTALGTKKMNFSEIRTTVIENYRKLVDAAVGKYYPTERRLTEMHEYISKEILLKYEDSIKFAHNTRNTGLLNKQLYQAVEEFEPM